MLQKFNERIQGVVAWFIVILVTSTFTLFGLDYYLHSHHSSNVKVKINEYSITKDSFELNYRRIRLHQARDALLSEQEQALRQQVLSEMIAKAVSVQAAHKNGFEVNGQQAIAAILQIPQFQEDGHFSSSRYAQALSNALFTPQSFKQEVRQGMLLNQQRFALIGTEFVLPNELTHFVALSAQRRDYHYAVIQANDFKASLAITPEEELAYYQAHQSQFMTKEQVSIDFVRLSLPAIKAKTTISSRDVLRYYADNKNNYLTPAQWQLDYVQFPVQKESATPDAAAQAHEAAKQFYAAVSAEPQQFNALAQQALNQQHAQILNLPPVVAGQSPLAVDLINLTKPGQISQPIQTEQGYAVVQVKTYQPAVIQAFSEVRHLIVEQLQQESAQERYAAMEEQLSELSYQNPDSLAAVAKALNLPVEKSALFAKDGLGSDRITQNPAIKQAAFSHDVLILGNNSDPIQVDSDTVLVLRINQHLPAVLQNISQVHDVIDSVLLSQKASLAAKKFGDKIIASKSPTLPNSLTWRAVTAATRDSELSDPDINELAFATQEPGDYAGHWLQNGDFAVLHLDRIRVGALNGADKEQTRNFSQQLEASYGRMNYDLYISQWMSQAKVTNPA